MFFPRGHRPPAVIDTLVESETRVRQKIEGLARALDLVSSRRPLTAILVGPLPNTTTIEAIARVCRVLQVGTPTGSTADQSLRDALAVLLPLELPDVSGAIADPLGEAKRRTQIESASHGSTVKALYDAAPMGAGAVREALRKEIEDALKRENVKGQS